MSNQQDEKEYGAAFALQCQIKDFLKLPGDIQRGLVDAILRIGSIDFGCIYVLRSRIEAGDLDQVRAILVLLNRR